MRSCAVSELLRSGHLVWTVDFYFTLRQWLVQCVTPCIPKRYQVNNVTVFSTIYFFSMQSVFSVSTYYVLIILKRKPMKI